MEKSLNKKNIALLVTGGRDYTNAQKIYDTLRVHLDDNVILINGDCRGADNLSSRTAIHFGFKVKTHPADWGKYGKSAGPRRNQQMVDDLVEYENSGYETLVYAFHEDIEKSKGTKGCVQYARGKSLKVILVT